MFDSRYALDEESVAIARESPAGSGVNDAGWRGRLRKTARDHLSRFDLYETGYLTTQRWYIASSMHCILGVIW